MAGKENTAETSRRRRSGPQKTHIQSSGKQKKEVEVKNYVQDFIPIKAIKDGMIETTDGRYVKIVEIEPINFMLRSPEEQNMIISSFASWFKNAPWHFQFKSITKKADAEKHIQMLTEEMKMEPCEKTRELSKSYIKLIRDVGTSEALTRRFFFIFEYEPFADQRASSDYNEIYNTVMSMAQEFKGYMTQCGNNVIVPKNEDVFLGEVLFMFFNRRSCLSDDSLQGRIRRVVQDTMTSLDRVYGVDQIPTISAVNYVAPRGIDISHVGYVIMDGLYYTFLYVKQDGYPHNVMAGWLSILVNAGDGIDVDIHFRKEDTHSISEDVARAIRLNRIKMKDTYDTQSDYEELRNNIASSYYIKQAMTMNEDLFYMSTLITISAKTYEGLLRKRRMLTAMLNGRDITVSQLKFRQEQALKSVMPLNYLDKEIFMKSRRNVMTTGAASTYMFTAFEMSDENGILLGINQHNSSLCIIDIFNTKMYNNANMCILGTSGSGKTFTEQLMALRMRMRGIQVFVLAPLKGFEFRKACNEIGGQYIKISGASKSCINIMEIRVFEDESAKILEGEDAIEDESFLAKKLQQLHIFFSLLIPDMTNEEEQLLDEALVNTYAMKGITQENDSLYEEDDPTKLKEMPTLGNVYHLLDNNPQTRRLATILSKFVTGSAQNFNKQTNVNLDNKYIVMDISDLSDETMRNVGTFIALDYIWDKVKEDRTVKKAVFIDETWVLIGAKSNKYAAEFVLEIFKIIRGYGGAAIAATQELDDFYALEGGKYGKGIVNNSETKIILKMKQDGARFVRDMFRLSKVEFRQIIGFSRGQAMIICNNNKVTVNIKPSLTEEKMITTDRALLAAQMQEIKEEELKKEKIARDKEMAERRQVQKPADSGENS